MEAERRSARGTKFVALIFTIQMILLTSCDKQSSAPIQTQTKGHDVEQNDTPEPEQHGPENASQRLHKAISDGKMSEIRRLLLSQKSININALDIANLTPLYKAANRGQQETVKLLLKKGANVHLRGVNGQTPLHVACGWQPDYTGYYEVVQLLLRKGADFRSKDDGGRTPLHEVSNARIASLLIAAGADVNAKADGGGTPLHITVDVETAKVFIKAGADIGAYESYGDGFAPLHQQIVAGKLAIVKLLIDSGADVNARTSRRRKRTPLHLAARMGHEKITKLLLSEGASINAVGREGWTPLLMAAYKNHEDIVKILLDHGADATIVCKNNESALSYAKWNRNRVMINLLEKALK